QSGCGSLIRTRATLPMSSQRVGNGPRRWYEDGMNAARILVVDDDPDIRALVVELLERAGHKVEQAPDGRSGLRALHATPPDLVRHPRQVLSRDQLLELVWGDAFGVSGDQVKLYVGYLRRKLDPDAPDSVPIETVRGFGYRYKTPG